jgi:hypothetical protein
MNKVKTIKLRVFQIFAWDQSTWFSMNSLFLTCYKENSAFFYAVQLEILTKTTVS